MTTEYDQGRAKVDGRRRLGAGQPNSICLEGLLYNILDDASYQISIIMNYVSSAQRNVNQLGFLPLDVLVLFTGIIEFLNFVKLVKVVATIRMVQIVYMIETDGTLRSYSSLIS